MRASHGGSVVKNLPGDAGDTEDVGLIPGSGRHSGGGNSKPLQYSHLGNPVGYSLWGSQRIGHDSDTSTLSMHLSIYILLVLLLQRTLITTPYLIWTGKILFTSQAFTPVASHCSRRTSASPVSIFFTCQSIPNASLNVGSLKPGASHIFSPSVSNVLRQLTFVWWRACNSCLGIVSSCQHGLFHLFPGNRKMELSRAAHAMTTRDDPNTGSRNLARGMHCWWQNRNKAPEARLST